MTHLKEMQPLSKMKINWCRSGSSCWVNCGGAALLLRAVVELGTRKLLFAQVLGDMMEAGAVLLLLLLGALCTTSDATFYGNSINFMAQKGNKNGTFMVGRTIFLFHNLLKEIKPKHKQLVQLQSFPLYKCQNVIFSLAFVPAWQIYWQRRSLWCGLTMQDPRLVALQVQMRRKILNGSLNNLN